METQISSEVVNKEINDVTKVPKAHQLSQRQSAAKAEPPKKTWIELEREAMNIHSVINPSSQDINIKFV